MKKDKKDDFGNINKGQDLLHEQLMYNRIAAVIHGHSESEINEETIIPEYLTD